MSAPLSPELSGLLRAADATAREAAWAAFLASHSRLLLHTARSLGCDYDATMDAYAFLLEQLSRDDFHRLRAYGSDGRCKFTTWLVVVTRRLCHDFYRQRYGRPRGADPAAGNRRVTRRRLVDLVAEQLDVARLAQSPAARPDAELQKRELDEALARAVEALEPTDRLLVKLRFEDDVPVREIADILRLPSPFHVYRRIGAVLKTLRGQLARRGFESPVP